MISVRFRDVRFAYPDGPHALDEVDILLQAGEITLCSGGSGSGKSTLLRAATGIVPHSSGGTFGGEVLVGERSTRSCPPRALAGTVAFVHQDPEAQFVVDRVESDVAFVLENLGMERAAMRRRVEEVLDAVGIAHLRRRSITTLSGGERQRVAVAGAIAAGPAVLVLDEPTSELDPQGAEDVLAAVARLNDDLGTTVLVSEHRLERAGSLAHRAVLMAHGRVLAHGEPRGVLAGYAGAPPVTHLGRMLGWDPVPLTVGEARRAAARWNGSLGVEAAPSRPGHAAGEVLLSCHGVGASRGRTEVLSGVDLAVGEGEVVAVLGRNGSGKTTLLRILSGLATPSRGEVRTEASRAYVPQDPNTLLFSPTVRRELTETLRLRRLVDDGRVQRWLERLGIGELAERHPRSLSSGQRQRVAIAAVAVGDPDVLVLDEPTRGMDAASREALRVAVEEHAADGGAVVLATHDVELAARCATTVVVLGDGEVVAAGQMRQVLSGSLFAPQVLRVLPPLLTVDEVAAARERVR